MGGEGLVNHCRQPASPMKHLSYLSQCMQVSSIKWGPWGCVGEKKSGGGGAEGSHPAIRTYASSRAAFLLCQIPTEALSGIRFTLHSLQV